jgi:hypothetical protein
MLIVPLADPVPVHLAIQPLAFIFVELSAAYTPPGYCVTSESALVVGPVGVGQSARAVFHTCDK